MTGGGARQKISVRGPGKAGGETAQCVETTEEFVLFIFSEKTNRSRNNYGTPGTKPLPNSLDIL